MRCPRVAAAAVAAAGGAGGGGLDASTCRQARSAAGAAIPVSIFKYSCSNRVRYFFSNVSFCLLIIFVGVV